jgi:tripartite-type tricarboxylate transporter receptor subunit TctC
VIKPDAEQAMLKIITGALIAVVPALASMSAVAQEYPSKTVTVIVAFPPGGDADIFSRLFSQKLAAAFGKSVVVDNRAGASGNIGAEAVIRATPDGHTILYGTSSLAVVPALYKKLPFDAERDLAPVSETVSIPLILVVHPALPARSVKELVALGRAHPGSLAFSGGSTGALFHLTGELFKYRTKLDAPHIAYKGLGPTQVALLSGEIQFAFLSPPVVRPYVSTGKLRALAIAAAARSPMLPQVPTFQEAGVTGVESHQWHGFFVPAKAPAAVVTRLHAEVVKALAAPDMKERIAAEGATGIGGTPAELAAFFRSEAEKWANVVQYAGIRLE